MNKKQRIIMFSLLILIGIAVAFIQFQIVSSSDYSSYSSFYQLRQAESIQETGTPIFFDDLSYQGRANITQVVFQYFISLAMFVVPAILFLKYASIFMWMIIVFMIYLISNRLFANKFMVWVLTFIAILSPTLLTANLNSFEPHILFAVVFLIILNLFLSIKKEQAPLFIILILLSSLISSLSLVFIVGFLVYAILVKISSKNLTRLETELILFSGVFVAWLHIILYRNLFLEHGVSLFQASVPSELLLGSFYGLSIPVALSIVGLVPTILGLYGTYFVLFKEANKKHLLLVSFLIAFVIALMAGFLSFTQGFFFITLILVLLTGITIKQINGYFNKTVFTKSKTIFIVVILVLVAVNFLPIFSYGPVIRDQSPTNDEIQTMKYISEETKVDSTILSTIQEGHLISSMGMRKNFFDTNFIFAPQANQRYADARMMFLSKSEASVVRQMDYYGIDYVYLSRLTQENYQFTSTTFETGDCFVLIYETNTTKLFEEICNN